MNACTAPRPGLCSLSAPRKRQIERLAVPESDGFFTPEIRPDSGRCSKPVSHVGNWWDARSARPRAALNRGFLAPPVPGAKPVQSLSLGD